jgi:hypothetical protein
MKKILQIISYLGLILTVSPGFLVFMGKMSFENYKIWVLAGTILWFTTAPFWINMSRQKKTPDQ